MNKTASVLELLLLLVVVVITSAVVLFLVQSGMISVKAVSNEPILNTEFIPLGREGSINLQEIKLCEFVDKDFHCFNEKKSFVPGDKVYLVFLVESSAYNGQIMIVRNYRLRNFQGDVILDIDAKNNYNFDLQSPKEKEFVAFADYFTTGKDYLPGEYTIDVILENPLLMKKITSSKKFTVL